MVNLTESEQMRNLIRLTEGTYWNNAGQYEKQAAYLQKLVPAMGAAETLQGELWRATSKIYYDFNNNGFGNDWSEAAAFIFRRADGALSSDIRRYLLDHGKGIIADDTRGPAEGLMERFVDSMIEYIINEVDPATPSPGDMWETDTSGYDWAEEDEEYDDYYDTHYDDHDDEYDF